MNDFFVIGIGSSAGGMNALTEFLLSIKEEMDAAIVIVSHLERNHKSFLTTILSKRTFLPTKTIENGEQVMPNVIYVMPENSKVNIREGRLYLRMRPEGEKINKAIDDFFISLAEDQKEKAIGVILSGLGSDGTEGAVRIKANGGMVIAQEPVSAQFQTMPLNTINHDHPDFILTPGKMPAQLIEFIKNKKLVIKDK